jgi:hypothetical protein
MLIDDTNGTTANSLCAVLAFVIIFFLIIWGFESSAWQSRQTKDSQAKGGASDKLFVRLNNRS